MWSFFFFLGDNLLHYLIKFSGAVRDTTGGPPSRGSRDSSEARFSTGPDRKSSVWRGAEVRTWTRRNLVTPRERDTSASRGGTEGGLCLCQRQPSWTSCFFFFTLSDSLAMISSFGVGSANTLCGIRQRRNDKSQMSGNLGEDECNLSSCERDGKSWT